MVLKYPLLSLQFLLVHVHVHVQVVEVEGKVLLCSGLLLLLLLLFVDEIVHNVGLTVDAKLPVHHLVDALGVPPRIRGLKARLEQRGLVHEHGHLAGLLALLVLLEELLQLLDRRVEGVHLQHLLAQVHLVGLRVRQRLRLGDPLHVGREPVLAAHHHARARRQPVGHLHRVQVVRHQLLPPLGEGSKGLAKLLLALLLGLAVLVSQREVLLGRVLELEVVELHQVLHQVLVHRLREVDDLVPFGDQPLRERGRLELLQGPADQVVQLLLAGLHALHVRLKVREGVSLLGKVRVRGLEAQELGQADAVGVVLDHPHLQVRPVILPELRVLLRRALPVRAAVGVLAILLVLLSRNGALLVVGDLLHHVEGLPDELLLDGLERGVVLEGLAVHVQWERVRIHQANHKAEVLGNQVVEGVRDEDAAHVELDARHHRGVGVLAQLKGLFLGDVQDAPELHVALRLEVRLGQRLRLRAELPLRDHLEELRVVLLRHLARRPQPDRLGRVLPLPNLLRHRLGDHLHLLFFFFLSIICLLVLIIFVVVVVVFEVDFLFVVLVDLHLDVALLLLHQEDRVVDELRVLRHKLPKHVHVQVLARILLQEQVQLRPPPQGKTLRVRTGDGAGLRLRAASLISLRRPGGAGVLVDVEVAVGGRLPDVRAVVVVVLADDLDLVRREKSRVEAHAELPDEVHVPALGHRVDEGGGPALRDGAQVLHQVGLGHPDPSVQDRQHAVLRVRADAHLQVLARRQRVRLGQRQQADLVKGVRGVRDQLAKEDVLVGVERVHDDVQQARHLRLEGEGLAVRALVGARQREEPPEGF
mmetsp:Transcript_30074/g.64217  ORF Transcript_30074/g.64217 Transcript_30074/m.64217 type:complete len:816 (-) Transcript_30074:293-2740(-)